MQKFSTSWMKQPPLKIPLVRILLVCTGAFLMALNIKMFTKTGNILPGGFTGLSLLIQELVQKFFHVELPFAPISYALNMVPVVLSFIFIGKRYTIYSCIMIVLSGFFTDFIPVIHITDNILMAAIFGGLLNAFAIFLCLISGATSGGTDFIAIFISEKTGRDSWNYILAFNMVILSIAGFVFNFEQALYSIIFQFTSTMALQTLYGRYQRVTIFIVTENPELCYKIIKDETNHDATELQGIGCFKKTCKTVLYSVISKDEANKVTAKLKKEDKTSFINVIKSENIVGKFYTPPKD